MNEDKTLKAKRMIIFFCVTFGVTAVMGIIMRYGYYKGLDTYLFGMAQMLNPALGVMIAILMTKKQKVVPEAFFGCYIFIAISYIILTVGGVLLPQLSLNIPLEAMFILSVVLGCTALAQSEDVAKKYGIKGGDLKKSIFVIFLFILMYFTVLFVSHIMGETNYLLSKLATSDIWLGIIGLIPLFFLTFIPYFGEEYGWRFYLQPALQKKIGKRKGVIVLGLIWGIWHLPVCYFYYSTPDAGITVILIQLIVCMALGIFFAYAYMKTKSIWTVSFLHYFNNNMGGLLNIEFSKIYESGWEGLASITAAYAIFLTVLLSKNFKEDEYSLPTLEERENEEGRSTEYN